jgi:putative PIN family toxin of toxin-antitoxin system
MKVILDTNVLISGLFFGGPPYQVLQAWRDGRIDLVISPAILAEYAQVALRLSRKYPGIDISAFIDLVTVRSHIVQPRPLREPVCADPNDDMFLSCALAAKAGTIISGDRHLLAVSGFAGVQVLRPKTFVDAYL